MRTPLDGEGRAAAERQPAAAEGVGVGVVEIEAARGLAGRGYGPRGGDDIVETRGAAGKRCRSPVARRRPRAVRIGVPDRIAVADRDGDRAGRGGEGVGFAGRGSGAGEARNGGIGAAVGEQRVGAVFREGQFCAGEGERDEASRREGRGGAHMQAVVGRTVGREGEADGRARSDRKGGDGDGLCAVAADAQLAFMDSGGAGIGGVGKGQRERVGTGFSKAAVGRSAERIMQQILGDRVGSERSVDARAAGRDQGGGEPPQGVARCARLEDAAVVGEP